MRKASSSPIPLKPSTSADIKQERKLDALEDIFLKHGFKNVTVEHLAHELHCSKRSLYQLAPSKEELFLRVFSRYQSRLRAEGFKNAQGVAPQDAFVGYLQPAIDASRKLSDTALDDIRSYEPANEIWEMHRKERMDGLRDLIERCVAEGIFRRTNPIFVAEVFTTSLRRICDPQFLATSKLSYHEAVTNLYELLLNGLLHSGPPARPEEKSQLKNARKLKRADQ
jgi:AcrR family transcriptional regulator